MLEDDLTPAERARALYQIERERALGQGKTVMRRRGDPGKILPGEASERQMAEAKAQFDKMSEQKTHRRNRNL